jgi:hypothetical protein
MKTYIPTFEQFVNESLNEGAVKAFEMVVSKLIQDVKRGYGWIDPDYVPDSFAFTAGGEGFKWDNAIAAEVYRRLIKAGVLWEANPDNPEEKGRKITSLSQLGIKESYEGLEESVDMDELKFTLDKLKKENPGKKVTYTFVKDSPKGYKFFIDGKLLKESVNEGKDDFVPATLVKDSGDLRKGQVVKVNALEYTK